MGSARRAVKRLHSRLYEMTLHSCRRAPVLWSKGISQYCDFKGPDSYWFQPTESCQPAPFFQQHYEAAHGLIWIRLSGLSRLGRECDLDNFVRYALPSIRKPFALITTDGDVSVPSDLRGETVEALLGNPWLVSWHTQNHDGHRHPRLAPIPIGLDLHTPRFWSSPKRLISLLRHIRSQRLPATECPLRIFCDLNINLNSEERKKAVTEFSQSDRVDFLEKRVPQAAIWRRYAKYPFVLSAPGVGLDCHRTWELLCLGCIVITKTSSLDPLYQDLPVVIVEDWRESHDLSNLVAWRDRYAPLTEADYVWNRLDPEAWLRPIRERITAEGRL